jgi:GTP pyrophosphokinase
MTNTPETPHPLPDRMAVKKLYDSLRPGLEEQLLRVQRKLRGLLEELGYTPTIKYRVKGFDNYFNKLLKLYREQPQRPLLISDLLGLRVICPFLEDLDTIERLINANFGVVELERKGDRHSFREFGYDSVHLLVRLEPDQQPRLPYTDNYCEIQLRTILQDAWAEVEHELVYKSDIALPNDSIKRKLASLNASLSLSDLIFQEIRDYQKEVRARGLKRRQSVEEILAATSSIEVAQRPDDQEGQQVLDLLELAEGSPCNLEKLMYKALEAHSNKNFQGAIQLYSRILRTKLDPALRSLVYNHRGMALFALAEYFRAIEDFSRALHFNDANSRAWCNRGLVYRVQRKYDQSLEDYDQSIAIAPEQLDGFWGRAQTCFEMKLYSRALADCQKVLALQSDFTPAEDLEKTIRRQIF